MPKWISVEKAVIKYHIEKEAIKSGKTRRAA